MFVLYDILKISYPHNTRLVAWVWGGNPRYLDVDSIVNRAWHTPCPMHGDIDYISRVRTDRGLRSKESTLITTLAMPRPWSVRFLHCDKYSTCLNFKGMFKATPLFQGGEKAMPWVGKKMGAAQGFECLEPKWRRDHNDLWTHDHMIIWSYDDMAIAIIGYDHMIIW